MTTVIPRRPPWYGNRVEPTYCDGYDIGVQPTPYGDGWMVSYKTQLFQKWGRDEAVIRSNHIEFSDEEWAEIMSVIWVEVVITDWRRACRARTIELVRNHALIRRSGTEVHVVYLPVFRADRLQTLGSFDD